MECNFSKNPGAEQASETFCETNDTPVKDVEVESTTTVAGNTDTAVATRQTIVLGDYIPELDDIVFPRLNIVQKVGDLSNSFEHGSILLAQNEILYTPPVKDGKGKVTEAGTPPVEIVVMGFKKKRFIEKVPFDSGIRSRVFGSEQEVVKNGGTLSYQEWELKKSEGISLFNPSVDCLVGIRKPDGVADQHELSFGYHVGDQRWAVALWQLTRTSYTAAAKKLFTERATGCLRKGYPTFTHSLSTVLKCFNKNWYFAPVLIPREPSSPELLEFVRTALSFE